MLLTLPWHAKAVIIGFDTVIYMVNSKSPREPPNTGAHRDNISGMLGKTLPEVLMYRTHRYSLCGIWYIAVEDA